MSRSVYVPNSAAVVSYHTWEDDEQLGNWEEHVEWLRKELHSLFPSFHESSRQWIGNEGRGLSENHYCYFGVSNYGGYVAVWLYPKEHHCCKFCNHWLCQVQPKFEWAFGTMNPIGRASNGEVFFKKKS